MATLQEVAIKVANELTRSGIAPAQRNNVYSSYLVDLGNELKTVLRQSATFNLREDVAIFAREMSEVMNLKEDPAKSSDQESVISSLNGIHFQFGKLQHYEMPRDEEIVRILIHIANWAMIGRNAVSRGRIFK